MCAGTDMEKLFSLETFSASSLSSGYMSPPLGMWYMEPGALVMALIAGRMEMASWISAGAVLWSCVTNGHGAENKKTQPRSSEEGGRRQAANDQHEAEAASWPQGPSLCLG